jgi:hypothetical protein
MRGNLKCLGIRPRAPDDNVTAIFRSQLMESPATGPPWSLLLPSAASRRAVDSASTIRPTHDNEVKKGVVLNRPSAYYPRNWQRSEIRPSLCITPVHEWCTDGAHWMAGCLPRNKQGFQNSHLLSQESIKGFASGNGLSTRNG